MAIMAGCRHSTSPAIPIASLTPYARITAGPSFTTATESQSLGTPSIVPSAQATSEVHPQPTTGVSAPQTPIPYPAPRTISGTSPSPTYTFTPTTQPVVLASTTQTPTNTPQPSLTATAADTEVPEYPGPGQYPYSTEAYPGPQVTQTYYPTATSTTFTSTRPRTTTPQPSTTISITPLPTTTLGTPLVTPTELPPRRPISPPPAGSNVSIWLAWNTSELEMLRLIIQSFQKSYPDVTFNVQNIPLDDLFTTYQQAAYLGQGPSLLLGPADWGPGLYDEELVTDLNPYVPADYLAEINPAALASGRYHDALISLPLAQRGVVMFRNSKLIQAAPLTFDQYIKDARAATQAGNVGSYLERGAYFSSADVLGLGGKLMDENDQPLFDDPTGLEWLNLLQAYHDAGAVTFNTNRDLDLFKQDRVGIIVEGTWNISTLTDALGAGNLAIDPWPTYGEGHLSGWVEADSVYLNANTTGNDRSAALAFMGYLLDPNVQMRLAEVGHIPSVVQTKPRDPLIQQAMQAFADGVPYPISVDASVLNLYWNALNGAILEVFVNGVDPADALKAASNEISLTLLNLQANP